ncbi:hypothetical protein M011DRAFT_389521, partial [Sporormia fimetaria CBS 119925]
GPHDLSISGRWLAHCLNKHLPCNKPMPELQSLPSRLIELRPKGAQIRARLRLREELPGECRFVTLSHCWGKGHTYSLRSDILSAFRTDIPGEQLPRTFQDAISVTHELGLSYVWIDSLCILQDSTSDWADEAQRMAGVYGSASLNIAATASTSSDAGLLIGHD